MRRLPSARRPATVIAALLALVLVSSSCLGLQRRGAVEPTPTKTGAYGGSLDLEDDALKIDEPAKTKKAGAKTGTLLVQLLDTERTPLAGAVLRYRGPAKGTRVTNRKGIARFELPPGSYTVDVVKCGRTLVVDDTAEATASIVAGATKQGRLEVDAHLVSPRYQPTNAATASENAPWARGATVTIGLRFDDTCTFEPAPSGVSVSAYRWQAGGSLEMVSAPVETSAKGIARAQLRCARDGDATLKVSHPDDPDAAIDVLASLPTTAFGEWCG